MGITEEERILQEAKSKKKIPPFGASVSIGQTVGAGTFTKDPYVRRQSVDMNLGVSPFWRITPLMQLSASVSVSTALIENYNTSSTKRHQWYLSDVGLGLSHARLFTIPGIGVGVGGGLGLSFPTSLQSQYRDLIVSTRGSLRMSKMLFGRLYLSYGFSMFKNFNRYTSPTIRQEDTDDYVVLAHYRGNEQVASDLISVGGNNTSFGLSNGFLASLYLTDKLSLAVFYRLSHSWTYRSYPDDELKAEHADPGRSMRDSQSGVIDLSYQFTRQISGSMGVQTMVSPKSADNKKFIFPFANFSNNYRNNTGVYLSVGARF